MKESRSSSYKIILNNFLGNFFYVQKLTDSDFFGVEIFRGNQLGIWLKSGYPVLRLKNFPG